MQNKRIIAVTGGIGSGKSEVSKCLSEHGKVLSCDKINAELLTDKNYLTKLQKAFPDAFTPEFDKKKLTQIIFSDKTARIKLNKIAHPEIMQRLISQISKSNSDVVFVEIPLLSGTEFEKLFSEIIVVEANEKTRVERIMKRDGTDSQMALKKIEGQKGDYSFPNSKVYTVENDGTIQDLNRSCEQLITKIFTK